MILDIKCDISVISKLEAGFAVIIKLETGFAETIVMVIIGELTGSVKISQFTAKHFLY
jgi:hypothetical protein